MKQVYGTPYVKRPLYETRDVPDWNCLDFMYYYIKQYNRLMVKKYPHVNDQIWEKNMKAIELSLEVRGHVLFRAMIDWVLNHYEEHPEWNNVYIGLVCGTHSLAEQIAEEARNELDTDSEEALDWRRV